MTFDQMTFFIILNGYDPKGLHEMSYAKLEKYYLKCKKHHDETLKKKKEAKERPVKKFFDMDEGWSRK